MGGDGLDPPEKVNMRRSRSFANSMMFKFELGPLKFALYPNIKMRDEARSASSGSQAGQK